MKITKSFLFGITALWLIILAYCAFLTDVSVVTLTLIYVTGQGFVTAMLVPYFQQRKKCKTSKELK